MEDPIFMVEKNKVAAQSVEDFPLLVEHLNLPFVIHHKVKLTHPIINSEKPIQLGSTVNH